MAFGQRHQQRHFGGPVPVVAAHRRDHEHPPAIHQALEAEDECLALIGRHLAKREQFFQLIDH